MQPVVSLPIQYTRQYAGPIDTDCVFVLTTDRTTYLSSPRRYAGQLVVDLQDGNVYYLNAALTAWIAVAGGSSDRSPLLAEKVGVTSNPPTLGSYTYTDSRLVGKNIQSYYVNKGFETQIDEDFTFVSGTGTITRPQKWNPNDTLLIP